MVETTLAYFSSNKCTQVMEDIRPPSPLLHLDLNNFDVPEAEKCRYVLTSPRSLQSCAKLGVKPVELLFKSLPEFMDEHKGMPLGSLRTLYDAHERERLRLLRLCREERNRLMERGGGIGAAIKQVPSALETVLEQRSDDQSTASKTPKATNGAQQKALRDKSAGILNGRRSVSFSDINKSFIGGSGDQHSQTTVSKFEGSRSNQARPQMGHYSTSTVSLGDLHHSQATERQMEQLTRDIQSKMSITVPSKDRKIAALMLVRREDELSRQQLSVWEERHRHEEQRHQEEQRLHTERLRKKELLRRIRRWQEDVEARRKRRMREEVQQAEMREQEMARHEERWRRLAQEKEARRKERMEAARREAEDRKISQERLLHDRERQEMQDRESETRLAQRREQRARRARRSQEHQERRRLQQDNFREQLRHVMQQRETQEQSQLEEEARRSLLEQKLLRSGQNRASLLQRRIQELQFRAAREAEQLREAQQRAGWHRRQLVRDKKVLAQIGQQRAQQAEQRAHVQRSNRVTQLRQENRRKEQWHRQLRQRVRQQQEREQEMRQRAAAEKERRCERLSQRRQELQKESRRVAEASFRMRERVREQASPKSFHKMALEAQLYSSMSKLKL